MPGEEQRADRHRKDAAPHDHQDRGRDDDGEHRRHRRDGDREGEVVAFLGLRLDEDLRLARRIRGGRARDAGKEDRQHHVDLRKPARPMADHRARQLQQPVGRAADVHQVRGEQEERHREQDERVVGVEGLLHQVHRVEPRLDRQNRQARERERESDRHPQEHEEEEAAEQNERRHSRRQHGTRHLISPGNDLEIGDHLLAEERRSTTRR